MTRVNRPRVSRLIGKVRITSIGLITAFTIPRNTDPTIAPQMVNSKPESNAAVSIMARMFNAHLMVQPCTKTPPSIPSATNVSRDVHIYIFYIYYILKAGPFRLFLPIMTAIDLFIQYTKRTPTASSPEIAQNQPFPQKTKKAPKPISEPANTCGTKQIIVKFDYLSSILASELNNVL